MSVGNFKLCFVFVLFFSCISLGIGKHVSELLLLVNTRKNISS